MNEDLEDLKIKELALTLTVDYFRDKQVSEEVFMRHLERVYNFLKTGNT